MHRRMAWHCRSVDAAAAAALQRQQFVGDGLHGAETLAIYSQGACQSSTQHNHCYHDLPLHKLVQ